MIKFKIIAISLWKINEYKLNDCFNRLRSSIIPKLRHPSTSMSFSHFLELLRKNINQQTKANKDYLWSKIFKTDQSVMKLKGYEYKTITDVFDSRESKEADAIRPAAGVREVQSPLHHL